MKRLLAGLAVLLVVTGPASATETVIRRATLLVADAEASIDFYQRLGFSVWYDQSGERDATRPTTLPLNVIPGYSRLIIMKGRDPWIGMVGLLAYDKPQPKPNRIEHKKIGLGDVILMLETNDISGIHARLTEAGATIIQAPKTFQATGADGTTMTGTNLFVMDPDGHVIELSQPAKPVNQAK